MAERYPITFDLGGITFYFRVVGVLIHEDRVLIHRADVERFWTLPGGRAEMDEFASEAVKREMMEELGVEVEVERLLWVADILANYNGTRYHEMAYFFLLSLPTDSPLYNRGESWTGDEEGLPLIFRWHPVDKLEDLDMPFYPAFLRQRLKSLPTYIEYLTFRDEDDAIS